MLFAILDLFVNLATFFVQCSIFHIILSLWPKTHHAAQSIQQWQHVIVMNPFKCQLRTKLFELQFLALGMTAINSCCHNDASMQPENVQVRGLSGVASPQDFS